MLERPEHRSVADSFRRSMLQKKPDLLQRPELLPEQCLCRMPLGFTADVGLLASDPLSAEPEVSSLQCGCGASCLGLPSSRPSPVSSFKLLPNSQLVLKQTFKLE